MARRVPLNDPATIIRYIEEDGGVILTGFSSIDDVQKVNADAAPFINAILEDVCRQRLRHPSPNLTNCPTTNTSLQRAKRSLPRETTRVTRLFGRSTTAREGWLQQPNLHEVFNYFLRTETIPYHDPNSMKLGTDPILSSAATLDIGPGVKAQGLHRDDFIWQQTHMVPREKYSSGSDVSMGLLVPGVNTTTENGATLVKLSATKMVNGRGSSTNLIQFIPGSHLWDDSRPPKNEEIVFAEMSVGEAFLFLGSTVHAGGTNTTSQSRPMHGFFYCRSFIRPEVCI